MESEPFTPKPTLAKAMRVSSLMQLLLSLDALAIVIISLIIMPQIDLEAFLDSNEEDMFNALEGGIVAGLMVLLFLFFGLLLAMFAAIGGKIRQLTQLERVSRETANRFLRNSFWYELSGFLPWIVVFFLLNGPSDAPFFIIAAISSGAAAGASVNLSKWIDDFHAQGIPPMAKEQIQMHFKLALGGWMAGAIVAFISAFIQEAGLIGILIFLLSASVANFSLWRVNRRLQTHFFALLTYYST